MSKRKRDPRKMRQKFRKNLALKKHRSEKQEAELRGLIRLTTVSLNSVLDLGLTKESDIAKLMELQSQ